MTLFSGFRVTGLVAVVVGLILVTWSAGFLQRMRGGMTLILLTIVMLLVGGGFVAPLTGLIAGAAGTRAGARDAPSTSGRARLPARARRLLGRLWSWTLVAFVAWFLAPG